MLVSFDDPLNLPQVRVVGAQLTETEITLQVEHSQHFAICHKCGAQATEFFRNGEKLMLRHLPIFNRPVFLVLQTKRYRCLHCGGGRPPLSKEIGMILKPAAQRLLLSFCCWS